ncbi:rab-45, partial [Aphelenchoides avenae]
QQHNVQRSNSHHSSNHANEEDETGELSESDAMTISDTDSDIFGGGSRPLGDALVNGVNSGMSLVESNGPPDRTFRVVMCGDAAVGKSSIVLRIVKKAFQKGLPSTLGVDFYVKGIRLGPHNVAIQLWDTAGQER